MDSDYDAFCEKIINEIDVVFKNDNELCDFEIVPVPFNQNKSPIIYVNQQRILGVESWCIKYIYEYAHRMILEHKRDQLKFHKNSLVKLKKYLNCAILINPDVSTFWNIRRILVEKLQLIVSQEFLFSAIVLSRKPKSNEAFIYRRFLYSFESLETIDWNFELSLCEKCAEKKNSNYHAFNHRQWVLQKSPDLLNFELVKTEKFIRKNIGDYSCYHHRNIVLVKLFEFGFYDMDDVNISNLLKNVNDVLQGEQTVNNLDELVQYLVPNVPLANINRSKLNCFVYCLAISFNDICFMNELQQMHGNYEAFKCYKRITIKFMVDILRIVNQTNYLLLANSANSEIEKQQSSDQLHPQQQQYIRFIEILPKFYQLDEKFSKIFLNVR